MSKPLQNLRPATLKTTKQSYRVSRSIQVLVQEISAKNRDKIGTIKGLLYNSVHKKKSNKEPGYI